MQQTQKGYIYGWLMVLGVFVGGFIFFYSVAALMAISSDKSFGVFAFCLVALAGAFNFMIDFFNPLAPVPTYASELCRGNLEDGADRRKPDYKKLRVPSIVLLGVGTVIELLSLGQGG